MRQINSKKRFLISLLAISALILLIYKIRAPNKLPVTFTDLVLSPDGKNLLGNYFDYSSGLFTMNVDEGRPQLISQTESAQNPSWSGDSQSVYFMFNGTKSGPEGWGDHYDIKRKKVSSDEVPETLLTMPSAQGAIDHPKPSPDGRYVAFSETLRTPGRKFIDRCGIFDLQSKKTAFIDKYPLNGVSSPAQWSSDGKTLFFISEPDTESQNLESIRKRMISPYNGVVMYSVDSGQTQFINLSSNYIVVSRNSDKISVVTGRDSNGELNVLKVVDLTGKEILHIKSASISPNVVWNQDDSALFFTTGGASGNVKINRLNLADRAVTVVKTETKRRGKLLGYANGRLIYAMVDGKGDGQDGSRVETLEVK